MMTSRCEYRLLLRQDNADRRLLEDAHRLGLVSDQRYETKKELFAQIDGEVERAEKTFLPPSDPLNEILASVNSPGVTGGIRLADLLRRPGIGYAQLTAVDPTRPSYDEEVFERAEIEIKYAGYIKRQLAQAEQFDQMESRAIPEGIDYHAIDGLRLEARQKLSQIRPENLGRASRISGVSPADITVLMIYLNLKEK
jgi:tRNA uridine 5-carboxymethylaminomethyl modification enzyme